MLDENIFSHNEFLSVQNKHKRICHSSKDPKKVKTFWQNIKSRPTASIHQKKNFIFVSSGVHFYQQLCNYHINRPGLKKATQHKNSLLLHTLTKSDTRVQLQLQQRQYYNAFKKGQPWWFNMFRGNSHYFRFHNCQIKQVDTAFLNRKMNILF